MQFLKKLGRRSRRQPISWSRKKKPANCGITSESWNVPQSLCRVDSYHEIRTLSPRIPTAGHHVHSDERCNCTGIKTARPESERSELKTTSTSGSGQANCFAVIQLPTALSEENVKNVDERKIKAHWRWQLFPTRAYIRVLKARYNNL